MNENLIPFSKRTKAEQRKIQSNGGKKSGEARRRKKALKERMKALLELPATDNQGINNALMIGVDDNDIDNETLLVIALFEKAKSGDVKAFQEIRNLIGQDNATEELKIKKKELQLKEKSMNGDERITGVVTIVDDIKTD